MAPPPPWYSRPATAVAAVLVAVLAAGTAVWAITSGSGLSGGGASPAPVVVQTAAAASPEPTTTAAADTADPASALRALAAADSPTVEGLVGQWVPQLSSKRPGLVADGRTYDAAAILAEHQDLRAQHADARLVWTGDFANYRGRDFWATVVGEPATTSAAANAWCDAQGLDADHCYAVRLTHSGGPEGNAVLRPH